MESFEQGRKICPIAKGTEQNDCDREVGDNIAPSVRGCSGGGGVCFGRVTKCGGRQTGGRGQPDQRSTGPGLLKGGALRLLLGPPLAAPLLTPKKMMILFNQKKLLFKKVT